MNQDNATPLVLVVEDDQTLLETIAWNLERQEYRVLTATNGRVGLDLALAQLPDLILLDVMLPGMDGFELCRALRREMNCPILMLTARAEEIDKIVGLEMGADDYISKPFSMRELMARVKAHLRRVRLIREESAGGEAESAESSNRLTFDNLTINMDRRELTVGGNVVYLKPKEYELLLFLARNRGIALSRDLILERVWGWPNDTSRTVDVHIRWLREKIEDDPGNARRIITVRGIGYRFEG
jgi:DNA-binding response OmpR family regulator